jgi:hypothetical protein
MVSESGGFRSAVDQHDAFLRNNDSAVRAGVSAGDIIDTVHIDAVANFLKVAAEILSAEGSVGNYPSQGNREKKTFRK